MNKITLFQFDTPIWYPILFRPTFIVETQSSKVSPVHKTGNKTSTTDTFYYVYKQRPQTNKGYHITFLYTHCTAAVGCDYVINLMYLLSFPVDAAKRNYKAINENCHMHIIQKYIQCQSYHSDIRLLLCWQKLLQASVNQEMKSRVVSALTRLMAASMVNGGRGRRDEWNMLSDDD